MPVAMQIYNTYRKNWIGRYMQDNGINVIPTVSWSTADNNDWIFDGIPTKSVIAISTLGCLKDKRATELFYEGWRTAQRKLQPSLVLCYGKIPDKIKENIVEMGRYKILRGAK